MITIQRKKLKYPYLSKFEKYRNFLKNTEIMGITGRVGKLLLLFDGNFLIALPPTSTVLLLASSPSSPMTRVPEKVKRLRFQLFCKKITIPCFNM